MRTLSQLIVTLNLAMAIMAGRMRRQESERLDLTPNRESQSCTSKNGNPGMCVHHSYCNDEFIILQGGNIIASELREKNECVGEYEWCCTLDEVDQPPKLNITTHEKCLATNGDEHSWFVALFKSPTDTQSATRLFCSGALVTSRVVLTAGTCIKSAQKQMLYVQVPASNSLQNYTVKNRRLHHNYNSDVAPNWTLMMDTHDKQYRIPEDVGVLSSRPDLSLYSKHLRRVITVELAVPWETHIPRDHTFKLNKYNELKNELSKNNFIENLYAVEVGARGTHVNDFGILVLDKDVDWGKGKERRVCLDFQSQSQGDCFSIGFAEGAIIATTLLSVETGGCRIETNGTGVSCGRNADSVCIVTPGAPVLCRSKDAVYTVVGVTKSNCRKEKVPIGDISSVSTWLKQELTAMNVVPNIYTYNKT